MLSIIIPTLNEEKYLTLLLDSINPHTKRTPTPKFGGEGRTLRSAEKNEICVRSGVGVKNQGFNDYEIIVADAGSKDRTVEIAKNYNCIIIKGGSPAKGRNEGAKAAKGELLLFLDADVVLPERFFEKALGEFKKRKINIAGFCLLPYKKNKFFHFLFIFFYNWPIIILEKILPHAVQILVEKNLFEKLNGYDESIKLAEDHDLARRAKKIAKFGIIKSTKVFISDRRFREDGWFAIAFRYLLCELHMIFLGPVRSDIFKYKFDHYSKKR